MWWFLFGWTAGWLLLMRMRPLPAAAATDAGKRTPVAVVVPVRNEAANLPELLPALVAQLRQGDELVVVDDSSTDGSAELAAEMGADVIPAGELPDGWAGKPHACAVGASATSAEWLVFIDADVRLEPGALDRLCAAQQPGVLVSVQPWHHMDRWHEQTSVLLNVLALMGSAAFTIAGPRAGSTMAFGPMMSLDRSAYDSVGGHGNAAVKNAAMEDLALARAVGRTEVYSGRPAVRFRMFSDGWRSMLRGWVRMLAVGVGATPWWAMVASIAWMSSLTAGWLAWPWAYPLSAVQVFVLGRRAAKSHPLGAALYPVLAAAAVALVTASLVVRLTGRRVEWKLRRVVNR
jgi:4,4'-diaponeurosporenoate glycosyltransferase